MSSNEKLSGRDPAPSIIRYLVIVSAFTAFLTGIAFIPAIAGSSSQEGDFYSRAIPSFFIIGCLTLFEWFILRYSRKIIGPYGIALGIEFFKSIMFNMGASVYLQTVSGASSTTFLIHQLASMITIFLLALTKIARTQIEALAKKDLSRNLLNLLPTLLVVMLFLSTYITEISGLGTPRQRSNFNPYTEKDINWSMFNTPTWDATYLLENLLDQFTAGLSAPDTPLFNVTSDDPVDPQDPIVYWRLGSLSQYEYTDKAPYTTDWNPTDTIKRIISPSPVGTPYSTLVPSAERTARFTVRLPLDHNSSTPDFSVHPNFQNFLPTTWNGEYGSFIDANTFELYDSVGNPLTVITRRSREIVPSAFATDMRGIDGYIQVSETALEEGHFDYTMDYMAPDIQTTAAFSLSTDAYNTIFDPTTWASVQNLYIQFPDLPSTIYVGGETRPSQPTDNYSNWAPTVSQLARDWTQPSQTVFGQAYYVMQQLGNDSKFPFDESMWLGEQVVGQQMAHPTEYEDFNEWFVNREEGGVSLHFASTYTMIMRLQNIPSRVVIGYIGGNDSVIYSPWRVITSRFLHAWSEVLVPIDPNPLLPGDEYVEWVSFDPLLIYLANQYGIDIPPDIVPPSGDEQTLFIRSDYDLETKGIFQAIQDHQSNPLDPIIGRVTVNNGTFGDGGSIPSGTTITLRTRLIKVPSLTTWLPYSGANITFFVGTQDENASIEGIVQNGLFLGYKLTTGDGRGEHTFVTNVAVHGIRTVNFYAIFEISPGNYRLAQSWTYNLTF
ncbi:transglutaminase-like domain-containing protein [Candidatus Hodarchaeum mangrovi]